MSKEAAKKALVDSGSIWKPKKKQRDPAKQLVAALTAGRGGKSAAAAPGIATYLPGLFHPQTVSNPRGGAHPGRGRGVPARARGRGRAAAAGRGRGAHHPPHRHPQHHHHHHHPQQLLLDGGMYAAETVAQTYVGEAGYYQEGAYYEDPAAGDPGAYAGGEGGTYIEEGGYAQAEGGVYTDGGYYEDPSAAGYEDPGAYEDPGTYEDPGAYDTGAYEDPGAEEYAAEDFGGEDVFADVGGEALGAVGEAASEGLLSGLMGGVFDMITG